MSGKIALDTDVSIKFLNGDTVVESIILKYYEIYLPVVVVGELIFGALNSKHPEQNLARHRKLIQRSKLLRISEVTANAYARTRLGLKKKGKPIPENDIWIAAACIENKLPLLSNDAHFKEIDHLNLITVG
jgi:tRNA(fMet)-specific endonuclease VapC